MNTRIPLSDAAAMGLAVLARRRRLGLTQQQLATAAHVPRARIYRLEGGEHVPPAVIEQVLDALGLTAYVELEDKRDVRILK